MSSRTPTIKLVSFAGAVPHVTVLVALMVLGWWLNRSNGPLIGLGLFLVLRFALRAIPHDHRSAIAFVRKHRFADAIPCFQRSSTFLIGTLGLTNTDHYCCFHHQARAIERWPWQTWGFAIRRLATDTMLDRSINNAWDVFRTVDLLRPP